MNKPKAIIGLDISTTKTGYALYFETQQKFIAHLIIEGTAEKMSSLLMERLGDDICQARLRNFELIVVIEDYTATLTHNDRTNVGDKIVSIKNEVLTFLKSTNTKVATALPWSWRSVYQLHTKVEHPNPKWGKVAQSLGHDLLKRESIESVNQHLHGILANHSLNDDEAEAALIAYSFIVTGKQTQDVSYYNPLRLTAGHVLEAVADDLGVLLS